jgi:hypothetical protein
MGTVPVGCDGRADAAVCVGRGCVGAVPRALLLAVCERELHVHGGRAGRAAAAPSGDMVMNLAALIAGAATDPYQNAYYQGDGGAPVEIAEACRGVFGPGVYAGYPGDLLRDNATGASFNVLGFAAPSSWSRGCGTPRPSPARGKASSTHQSKASPPSPAIRTSSSSMVCSSPP